MQGRQRLLGGINSDFNYYAYGDIYNQNGILGCWRDAAKWNAYVKDLNNKKAQQVAQEQAAAEAQMKAQQAAAAKAAKVQQIVGSEAAFAGAGELVLGFQPDTSMRIKGIQEMKSPEFGMAAAAAAPTISFDDAAKYYRKMLTLPNRAGVREQSINRAYAFTTGVKPSVTECATADAAMLAGKATYASLVLDLKGRMKADAAARKGMIERVYLNGFGRSAKTSDQAYWAPRSQGFAEMVAANRKWLYSPQGVTDRIVATTLAIHNSGGTPSDDAVKAALVRFGPAKATYAEMVAALKAKKSAPIKIGWRVRAGTGDERRCARLRVSAARFLPALR